MRPMAAAAALLVAVAASRALGLTAQRSLFAASLLLVTAGGADLAGVGAVSWAAADMAYLALVATGLASVLGRRSTRARGSDGFEEEDG